MTDAPVGWLDVVIYAGLEGETPVKLGISRLPISLSRTKNNALEVVLQEVFEYVKTDLEAVFGREVMPNAAP